MAHLKVHHGHVLLQWYLILAHVVHHFLDLVSNVSRRYIKLHAKWEKRKKKIHMDDLKAKAIHCL